MVVRWSTGLFETADARQWADQLGERGAAAITEAFESVVAAGDDHLDLSTGAAAMAAAEVVARWRHGTFTGYRPADDWLASVVGPPSTELLHTARSTVERVAGHRSSLAGLRDGDSDWSAVVETLTSWLTVTGLESQGTVVAGPIGISPNTSHASFEDEQRVTRRDRALLNALQTAGVDLTRRRTVAYHLFFQTERDAVGASGEASTEGWDVDVGEPDGQFAAWSLVAKRHEVLIDPGHVRESSAFFDRLSQEYNGLNDGWELLETDESD